MKLSEVTGLPALLDRSITCAVRSTGFHAVRYFDLGIGLAMASVGWLTAQ